MILHEKGFICCFIVIVVVPPKKSWRSAQLAAAHSQRHHHQPKKPIHLSPNSIPGNFQRAIESWAYGTILSTSFSNSSTDKETFLLEDICTNVDDNGRGA
mmetsp:Transcript_38291/g.66862  ORF Transcript_38291/g.66862 Transcript_38291/m.66862 type:complete len:100 (-) Transcript_38291:122-421(-)